MTPFLGGVLLGFILGALVVLAIGAIEAGREARAWHTSRDEDRMPSAERLDEMERRQPPAWPQRDEERRP